METAIVTLVIVILVVLWASRRKKRPPQPMSDKQHAFIRSLLRETGITEAELIATGRLTVSRLEDLTLDEASAVIDGLLKAKGKKPR